MARENVETVREPLTLRASAPGRRLDDHLTVGFPRLAAAMARTVMRRPLPSRLRRAAVRRTVESEGGSSCACQALPPRLRDDRACGARGVRIDPVYHGRCT